MIPIKRRLPSLTDEPDYSRAFYLDPPSHDFLVWLVTAEMMRRHHKAPGPLRVKFGLIDDQLGIYDFGPLSPWEFEAYPCGVSKAYSDQMIENVLRPAIEMMGAVEEPAEHAPFERERLAGYVEYDYHIGALVDAARAGFEVPKWKPPQWAFDEVDTFLGGTKPIVITLREAATQPERNSQIEEWLKFVGWVVGDEHRVLFVRDTAKADKLLWVCGTYPRASRNAYVRAALYQRALVNMMVGTGPVGWMLFSNAPYLMFKQLVPELKNWDHGQPSGWREQAHLEVGEQYPWASPLQRMTWSDDTFENIRSEFDNFMRLHG